MAGSPLPDPAQQPDPLAGIADPTLRAKAALVLQHLAMNNAAQQAAVQSPVAQMQMTAPPVPQAPVQPPVAQMAGMQAPPPSVPETNAPEVKQRPGPIKSFLSNFLYGGGQALLEKAGLPTDYEKAQNASKLALQQQSANDMTAYRQAQTGGLQARADALEAANQPFVIPADFPIKGLAGKTVTQGAYQGLLKAIPQYQGRVDVAQTNADSRETVADKNNAAKLSIADANVEARKAIAAGNWKLAAQRISQAGSNLSLRQLEYRMRAYGTGADGQPLPGAEFSTDGTPVGTAMQANVRPTVNARNAGERANTMQDLETRIRGALNDPSIRAGLGPAIGRINDVRGQAGALDGPLAELRNDLVSYGAFQAGLHPVRGIGGLQYFDKVMGGLGQTPEELLGKLDSNRATSKSVMSVAKGGRASTPAAPAAPSNRPAWDLGMPK